jgi:hypothetical protein
MADKQPTQWQSDLEAHKYLSNELRKEETEKARKIVVKEISHQELLNKIKENYKEINNLNSSEESDLDKFVNATFELFDLAVALTEYINNQQISEAINNFTYEYIGIAASAGFDFGITE